MENDLVMKRLHEYSLDLFRLTDKVITDCDGVRVRFVKSSGIGIYCRVYIAEDGQELTDDGNAYSLYENPDRWVETSRNYQRCKARLVRIITVNKKP